MKDLIILSIKNYIKIVIIKMRLVKRLDYYMLH